MRCPPISRLAASSLAGHLDAWMHKRWQGAQGLHASAQGCLMCEGYLLDSLGMLEAQGHGE